MTALKANVTTTGAEAVGIQAISLGGGGGNGGFSLSGAINAVPSDKAPNADLTFAVGGGGGNGNNGAAVLVHSDGTIFTSGDGAHGIQAQSIGGGGGNGGSSRSLALQLGPKPKTADDKKKAATTTRRCRFRSAATPAARATAAPSRSITPATSPRSAATHTASWRRASAAAAAPAATPTKAFRSCSVCRSATSCSSHSIARRNHRPRTSRSWSAAAAAAAATPNAVIVTNNGRITTYGDGSYGVFAQSIGGGGGAGGDGDLGTKGTVGVGGGTGSTGNGGTVTVNLSGAINTFGRRRARGVRAEHRRRRRRGGRCRSRTQELPEHRRRPRLRAGRRQRRRRRRGHRQQPRRISSRFGIGANGIFAQSIGGGGGVAGSLGDDFPILNVQNFAGSVGGTGSGNVVHVTQSANITTLGDAADGIFAQSAGGQQVGKAVTVTLSQGQHPGLRRRVERHLRAEHRSGRTRQHHGQHRRRWTAS